MTTRHWGDIPVITDTDSGIVALEREQLIKPRPLEIEDPMLYCPYPRAGVEGECIGQRPAPGTVLSPEQFDADPITLHTIQLVQHSRKMKSLIQQLRDNSKNDKNDTHLAASIPIPQYPETGKFNQQRTKSWSFQRPICKTELNSGIGFASCPIDNVDCRRLSRRSIATICAHVGFDMCKESALELLADITCEYYQRLTKHLRAAVDSQLLLGHSGFPDVLEQVFQECGVGSVHDLEDFYNNRVLRYHESMVSQCQQLVQDYEKLHQVNKTATEKTSVGSTEVNVKEEEDVGGDLVLPPSDEDKNENDAMEMEEFYLDVVGPMDMSFEQETVTTMVPELEWKIPAGMAEEQGLTKEMCLDADDEEPATNHGAG